jgi:hypothetical protein
VKPFVSFSMMLGIFVSRVVTFDRGIELRFTY